MPPDNPAIANYSHMVFPKDGYSNHALTFYFPECTPSNDTIIPNGNYSACWHREFAEKIYIVKKGPNFSTTIKKIPTELTAEMIQSGSWKSTQLKDYNLDSMGVVPEAGCLHPLLKVREN